MLVQSPKERLLGWPGGSTARGFRVPQDQLLDLRQILRALPLRSGGKHIYYAQGNIWRSPVPCSFPNNHACAAHRVENILVRVWDSFALANFVVMDIEGGLRVDLILGWPFLRARTRINIERGEIRFRVSKEDMFFKFKHRKEQCFLIQLDSKGQALWGAPLPQPGHQPTTSKRKKKTKVWRKVDSSASSNSPGRADQW